MSSPTYSRVARWGLSAPLVLFIILLGVFPVSYGVITSFLNRTLLSTDAPFTGFTNYSAVIADPAFWQSVKFTVLFTVVTVSLEVLIGLGLALLIDRPFPLKKTLITGVLMPIMIAPSLIGILWRLALNENMGLIPALFEQIGIEIHPFATDQVMITLFTADVLHWAPFIFLLCYAALQSFPDEIRESARVDGAGYWRTFWSLVLPFLKPVLAVALFIRVIDTARSFDIMYVLTGGGPGSLTSTTSLYIYRKAFVNGDFGAASAASVVMLLLMLLLVPLVVRQASSRKE